MTNHKGPENQSDSGTPKRSFAEQLWEMDERGLIQRYVVARKAGDTATALAILEAKATLAAQEAARETASLARQTRILSAATVAMAIATVVLVVVTMVK